MANRIKTEVLDIHGNKYTSDVYVEHDSMVNSMILADLKVPVMLKFYKSQADKTDKYAPFTAINNATDRLPLAMFVKKITEQEAAQLNAIMIQQYVTEYLKSIYGDANVETVQ